MVAHLPDDLEAGLYDLEVQVDGVLCRQPRSVRLDVEPPTSVRIAYTSDWHLLQVSGNGAERDRTPRLEALVDHLNDQGPDVVVHLGDLITRYRLPSKAPQPAAVMEWQVRRACRILERLRAPLFLLPGNHDVAFEVCRRSWACHVGRPPDGTDDSAVTLGPVQLVQLDGFVRYDEATYDMREESPRAAQLEFVAALAGSRPAPWRLLGVHYDYRRRILPRLGELGVDALFYGHSRQLEPEPLAAAGCVDGHLAGTTAYRVVTATASHLHVGDPVTYEDLG